MSLPTKYIDKYGHIKQDWPTYDGGDSFSFNGQYLIASHWQNKIRHLNNVSYATRKNWYRSAVKKLYKGFGMFSRHSHYDEWATKANRMSRDQIKANIYAMGLTEMWYELFMLTVFLVLRLGFTTNIFPNRLPSTEERLKNAKLPDFCGPDIFAMIIRSFSRKYKAIFYIFYPIVLLGDLQTVINAALKHKKDPKDANECNFICTLLQTLEFQTILSVIAIDIYKNRPKAALGYQKKYQSEFGPQTALDYFFGARHEKQIEPPLHDEYRPFLEKVLC